MPDYLPLSFFWICYWSWIESFIKVWDKRSVSSAQSQNLKPGYFWSKMWWSSRNDWVSWGLRLICGVTGKGAHALSAVCQPASTSTTLSFCRAREHGGVKDRAGIHTKETSRVVLKVQTWFWFNPLKVEVWLYDDWILHIYTTFICYTDKNTTINIWWWESDIWWYMTYDEPKLISNNDEQRNILIYRRYSKLFTQHHHGNTYEIKLMQ